MEKFPENISVTTNKLTFKVMKEIKKIASELPPTPLFMPNDKGEMQIQYRRLHKKVSGKKLLKENPDATYAGKLVLPNYIYSFHADEIIYISHIKNLIDAFKNGGLLGIEYYVAAVKKTLEELNKPAPKVIIETFKKEFSLEESNEPLPDHVIYSGPINEVNDFILERAGIHKEKFNLDVQSKKEEHDHVLIYTLNPSK